MALRQLVGNGYFSRYVFVGGLNTAVSYAGFLLLLTLGLHYLPASLLSYAVGVGNSYLWNKYFTFRPSALRGNEFLKFIGVYASQYLVGLVSLVGLVEIIGFGPILAQTLVLIIMVAVTFFAHRHWTFKDSARTSDAGAPHRHALDHVALWNAFRLALDVVFGMYRKGEARIREFGITRDMSLFDVGCGTGHYSRLTDAEYLGVDTDCRYIAYARKRYGTLRKRFACGRVQDVLPDGTSFEVALLSDVTHHLPTPELHKLLAAVAKITTRFLVVFDPVRQRRENRVGTLLTAHDRGKYIRAKDEELALIAEYFSIVRVVDVRMFFVEGIVVLAKPKTVIP